LKRGHVYAVPGGFAIYVMGWTTRGWNRAKAALSFARLTNDGDDEGALLLDRFPTKSEAQAIRKWTGIPKRVTYSAETLAAKREQMARVRQIAA
jgi:hypothetical protein